MKAQDSKDESSTHTAETRRYAELARDMSNVRQEKIEAIKKQIETGTYDVSPKLVARSIADLHRSLDKAVKKKS